MKKNKKGKGGFYYYVTDEQIQEHRKLSLEQKLEWLKAANLISYLTLRSRRKSIWEAFREGSI